VRTPAIGSSACAAARIEGFGAWLRERKPLNHAEFFKAAGLGPPPLVSGAINAPVTDIVGRDADLLKSIQCRHLIVASWQQRPGNLARTKRPLDRAISGA
jgi:hypothetical protein